MSAPEDGLLQQARQAAFTEATRLVMGHLQATPADVAAFFPEIANIADSLVAYYMHGEVVVPEVSFTTLVPSYKLHELRSAALDDAFRRAPAYPEWNAADGLSQAIQAADQMLAYTLYGQHVTPEQPSSGELPHAQASSNDLQGQKSSSAPAEGRVEENAHRSSLSPVVRVASATVAEPGADVESASGEGAL